MTNAPVMLTAEQFSQLPTKEYFDKRLSGFATKDDLKNFATKDYLDQKLKNFATKDDFKSLDEKMELRFNQLNYKLDINANDSDKRLKDHEARLCRLEFRVY